MKRGIPKEVGVIVKPVTYTYTRSLLLKHLRLPADAVLSVKAEDGDGPFEMLVTDTNPLKVEVKETVKTRTAKAAVDEAA